MLEWGAPGQEGQKLPTSFEWLLMDNPLWVDQGICNCPQYDIYLSWKTELKLLGLIMRWNRGIGESNLECVSGKDIKTKIKPGYINFDYRNFKSPH